MSQSEDINTLFRRFGGDASSYQEIVATDQAQAAEQHWPLLGQLKPLAHAEAPAAKRSVAVGGRMAQVEVVIYKTAPQPPVVFAEVLAPRAAPLPMAVAASPTIEIPVQVAAVVPVSVEAPPLAAHPIPPELPPPSPPAPQVGLQSVFERMLPRVPEAAQPAAADPLKRLIKW